MPSFDWTISLSNLIAAVLALLGLIRWIISLYNKIDECLHRIDTTTEHRAAERHAENRERIAVIESKIDVIEWYLKEQHGQQRPR